MNKIVFKNHTNHILYYRWYNMIRRCTLPKNKDYKNYGGRGIRVCDRWFTFQNFINDMLPTFEKDLTLDRKNNNKNYSPKNCRWVDRYTQNQNTRNTLRIEDGKGNTFCLSELSRIHGVAKVTLHRRIKKGFCFQELIK